MKTLSHTSRLLLATIVLAMLVCPARATQYGNVVIDVSSPPNAQRSHGYAEYRVTIANLSPVDRHKVKLILPEPSYSGGKVTRTVAVEPSSTAAVSLFTGADLNGNGLGVEIDGQLKQDVMVINLSGYGYDWRPTVLVSHGASTRAFQNRASTFLENPDGTDSFFAAKAETPVTEWSANWLGYSSYDGVVLTADEIRSMPEPARSAIGRYVECGGSLTVLGSWDVPGTWRPEFSKNGLLSIYPAGFGVCIVNKSERVEDLLEPQWQIIKQAWQESQTPWAQRREKAFDFSTANTDFPVTENVSIPVRGLLVIMLLFVITIGPVNLFVLSKKKRKMWLFWTVPAISLLTCLVVSAYSVWSEGWGGRARYLSFTILDERSHRASTIGINAFYAPLTPADGLRYGVETEITSRPINSYDGQRGTLRTADWTDDQHLETGWVTARTPAHFMVRRSETRRERLTVTPAAGGPLSVVNGLGVSIRDLLLADDKGVIYRATNIAPGASGILNVSGETPATGTAMGLRDAFSDSWIGLVQRSAHAPDLMRPGTYIALVDGCPFMEEGLKGARDKKCEAVVYGIMKRRGDED